MRIVICIAIACVLSLGIGRVLQLIMPSDVATVISFFIGVVLGAIAMNIGMFWHFEARR